MKDVRTFENSILAPAALSLSLFSLSACHFLPSDKQADNVSEANVCNSDPALDRISVLRSELFASMQESTCLLDRNLMADIATLNSKPKISSVVANSKDQANNAELLQSQASDLDSILSRLDKEISRLETQAAHDKEKFEELKMLYESLEGKGREDQKKIEQQQREIDAIRELQGQNLENIQSLNTQLANLKEKNEEIAEQLIELKSYKYLEVRFDFIDIYQDGSLRKDRWSLYATINGKEYTIWDKKGEISDNGHTLRGKGPDGDRDYKSYKLNTGFVVKVKNDESLTVEIHGKAHDKNRNVASVSRVFTPQENWGIGGGDFISIDSSTRMRRHRIGAGNKEGANATTSYWDYFLITEL
jgi:hypothetical protein